MRDGLPDASRLVAGLRSPAAYRHRVDAVEVIETHISWVVLAGEFAYKLKKPVDLGFVDFSTLERRRHFCEEEVRLNRRLAPELYLGVVPITGSPERPVVGGEGEPIEYAVAMRQLPQEALLSRVLERGELSRRHIDGLADTIAAFHGRIAVASPESPFGSPERVWQPAEENFEHIAAGIDDSLVRDLAGRSRAMFEARRGDFAHRKADGFVRECHGDMHLGNMLLLDGKVVVFDGIEFNDDLRWIDVLSEIAFVVMDLEDRARPDLARRLLNAYLERTGDYEGLTILPFYLTYRAMVRAKVASIRAGQADVSGKDREGLRAECRSYLRLADRYSRSGKPSLVITHGVSGSGKTTVTQQMLEATGAIRVRSDIERKRLFGLDPLDRDMADQLYTPEATERTYDRLAELAAAILIGGFPAIVDAAFLSRRHRDRFRELAACLGVSFRILDVRADKAVLRQRVAERIRAGRDASDAGLEVLQEQLRTRNPLGEDELAHADVVRTDAPPA
jgi:hypothetical protein